jgi:hypothetical protein
VGSLSPGAQTTTLDGNIGWQNQQNALNGYMFTTTTGNSASTSYTAAGLMNQ